MDVILAFCNKTALKIQRQPTVKVKLLGCLPASRVLDLLLLARKLQVFAEYVPATAAVVCGSQTL